MNTHGPIIRTRRLGVNIDHVATLKRLRDTSYPDLLSAAKAVIAGGAEQITVHLREDRRHIVDGDVYLLKKELPVDLNLECAATEEMLKIALEVKPHSICIVPEKREERTTEGGLDLSNSQRNQFLAKMISQAKERGILVSLFLEPDVQDMQKAFELGAQAVELHTGTLCIAHQAPLGHPMKERLAQEWQRVRSAAIKAHSLGLFVHAGHGIDRTIAPELGAITEIVEYNIGHAIVCDAVFTGITQATRDMKAALGI